MIFKVGNSENFFTHLKKYRKNQTYQEKLHFVYSFISIVFFDKQ